MCILNVNINEKEKSYPIHISNNNIENLQTIIMQEVGNNNYIVVIITWIVRIYIKFLLNNKNKKIIIYNNMLQ